MLRAPQYLVILLMQSYTVTHPIGGEKSDRETTSASKNSYHGEKPARLTNSSLPLLASPADFSTPDFKISASLGKFSCFSELIFLSLGKYAWLLKSLVSLQPN